MFAVLHEGKFYTNAKIKQLTEMILSRAEEKGFIISLKILSFSSGKCLSQSEVKRHLGYSIGPQKNPANLVEDAGIWLPVKFH